MPLASFNLKQWIEDNRDQLKPPMLNKPLWRDGSFVPRLLLPLSLSYDHRVIDGADAMRFLRWVVEAVEQPFLLSLLG